MIGHEAEYELKKAEDPKKSLGDRRRSGRNGSSKGASGKRA